MPFFILLRTKSIKTFIQSSILAALSLLSFIGHAETVTYYINDALGSPVAAMDQAGTVIWRESYNPFGEGRIKPSQNTNDVGYTSHQKDDATGLTYMQARYYDPTIGRFYGVDPAPFSNVHNFNRYAYGDNNPYRYTDPTGMCIQDACIVEGGLAVGTALVYATATVGIALGCVDFCGKIVDAIDDFVGNIFNESSSDSLGEKENKGQTKPEVDECPTCGGDTSNKPGKIGNKHGMKPKDVKGKIHGLKGDAKISGNPDVEVCNDCGEVFPQTDDGGLGDSIGNIDEEL